jgi:2-polyprenyl-3-methyl-5-hydroxy-6-metoxy-1,4-benzoquinol methylase
MTDNVQQYQQLLEPVVCNSCGADDYYVVYSAQYEHAKPEEIMHTFRSSGDEILLDQLVRCNQCGLQYLTPRLKSDVVITGYSEGADETFVSQAPGRERTFDKNLDLIERYRPEKGTILDVGTAGGSFLYVARKRGWMVQGCEPNKWMTEWAKGHYDLDVVPGTIFDMALADRSFDVVCLWDVLEHVPDPRATLEECRRVLKPGGLLIVNYPDIDSLVSRLMGRRWVFLLSIHLYYYTPETIKNILGQTGFKTLKIRMHWQTLEFGYILFRMQAYVGGLAKLAGRIVSAFGIQHWQIPYWMGQSLVIAEKVD